MNTTPVGVGAVHGDLLYTLAGLKKQLGISDATLRAARRVGLQVHYKHGRGYVAGQAWLDYMTNANGTNAPNLPTGSGTSSKR